MAAVKGSTETQDRRVSPTDEIAYSIMAISLVALVLLEWIFDGPDFAKQAIICTLSLGASFYVYRLTSEIRDMNERLRPDETSAAGLALILAGVLFEMAVVAMWVFGENIDLLFVYGGAVLIVIGLFVEITNLGATFARVSRELAKFFGNLWRLWLTLILLTAAVVVWFMDIEAMYQWGISGVALLLIVAVDWDYLKVAMKYAVQAVHDSFSWLRRNVRIRWCTVEKLLYFASFVSFALYPWAGEDHRDTFLIIGLITLTLALARHIPSIAKKFVKFGIEHPFGTFGLLAIVFLIIGLFGTTVPFGGPSYSWYVLAGISALFAFSPQIWRMLCGIPGALRSIGRGFVDMINAIGRGIRNAFEWSVGNWRVPFSLLLAVIAVVFLFMDDQLLRWGGFGASLLLLAVVNSQGLWRATIKTWEMMGRIARRIGEALSSLARGIGSWLQSLPAWFRLHHKGIFTYISIGLIFTAAIWESLDTSYRGCVLAAGLLLLVLTHQARIRLFSSRMLRGLPDFFRSIGRGLRKFASSFVRNWRDVSLWTGLIIVILVAFDVCFFGLERWHQLAVGVFFMLLPVIPAILRWIRESFPMFADALRRFFSSIPAFVKAHHKGLMTMFGLLFLALGLILDSLDQVFKIALLVIGSLLLLLAHGKGIASNLIRLGRRLWEQMVRMLEKLVSNIVTIVFGIGSFLFSVLAVIVLFGIHIDAFSFIVDQDIVIRISFAAIFGLVAVVAAQLARRNVSE